MKKMLLSQKYDPNSFDSNTKWFDDFYNFNQYGPTQSIIAHLTRAALGIRESQALTQAEVIAWPHNRTINP